VYYNIIIPHGIRMGRKVKISLALPETGACEVRQGEARQNAALFLQCLGCLAAPTRNRNLTS
jgi:hypothetical protein